MEYIQPFKERKRLKALPLLSPHHLYKSQVSELTGREMQIL